MPRVATDPGNLEKPGNPGKSWKNLENGSFCLKNLEKPGKWVRRTWKNLENGSPKAPNRYFGGISIIFFNELIFFTSINVFRPFGFQFIFYFTQFVN